MVSRSLCTRVVFKGAVELKSVKPRSSGGFQGRGGYVHTWVESDAGSVELMEGAVNAR
jgi:hypothetical protein